MIFTSYPFKNFNRHKRQILNSIEKTLNTGLYINGPNVKNFETNFAKYLGSKYAVGVANCTDAIFLSLQAIKTKNKFEVILPALSAPATLVAILNAGLTPIFSEINESDYNLDINLLKNKINKNTLAICNVSLYGQSNDINILSKLARDKNIFLIEDCAQSAGAEYKNKKLGTFGVTGCFSFFPTKNLSTYGDGGCISTSNQKIYKKILSLREYGWDKKRELTYKGLNSRLDELHASILNYKLNFLDKDNNERIQIANYYIKNIKNNKIILPKLEKYKRHVFHHFVIRVKERSKLRKILYSNGFNLGIHYELPLHKHKIISNKYKNIKLQLTERISKEIISLPIYQGLQKRYLKKLVDILNNY